jgi:hypothetical protein
MPRGSAALDVSYSLEIGSALDGGSAFARRPRIPVKHLAGKPSRKARRGSESKSWRAAPLSFFERTNQ